MGNQKVIVFVVTGFIRFDAKSPGCGFLGLDKSSHYEPVVNCFVRPDKSSHYELVVNCFAGPDKSGHYELVVVSLLL